LEGQILDLLLFIIIMDTFDVTNKKIYIFLSWA